MSVRCPSIADGRCHHTITSYGLHRHTMSSPRFVKSLLSNSICCEAARHIDLRGECVTWAKVSDAQIAGSNPVTHVCEYARSEASADS